jgi:tRNA-binding protein
VTPEKQKITFGKFQNVDLRVATVTAVEDAHGTTLPCKVLELDVGLLGARRSIGQFALVDVANLLNAKVIACVNLGEREMGPYVSQALVLGTPHPNSPAGQSQAVPLWADPLAQPGDTVF